MCQLHVARSGSAICLHVWYGEGELSAASPARFLLTSCGGHAVDHSVISTISELTTCKFGASVPALGYALSSKSCLLSRERKGQFGLRKYVPLSVPLIFALEKPLCSYWRAIGGLRMMFKYFDNLTWSENWFYALKTS